MLHHRDTKTGKNHREQATNPQVIQLILKWFDVPAIDTFTITKNTQPLSFFIIIINFLAQGINDLLISVMEFPRIGFSKDKVS